MSMYMELTLVELRAHILRVACELNDEELSAAQQGHHHYCWCPLPAME